MEPEVNIRCRQSDLNLVKEVVQSAIEEYKALMKKEVKIFKDKEVPIKVNIDDNKFLPEYTESEG